MSSVRVASSSRPNPCLIVSDYVVDCVVGTVHHSLERTWKSACPSPCLKQPTFINFVKCTLQSLGLPTGTILVAIVYLDRAKRQMRISKGDWACERAFLGALLLAYKVRSPCILVSTYVDIAPQYTNDTNTNPQIWSSASRLFAAQDVVQLEREMLAVLQFDLSFRNEDITAHYTAMMTRCRQPSVLSSGVSSSSPSFQSPLQYYDQYAAPSWSPGSSSSSESSSSASPYDSPMLLTPDIYLPTPPYDKSEYRRTASASTSGSVPYALANGYKDAWPSLVPPQPMQPQTHDYLFTRPLDLGNDNIFGDVTGLTTQAYNGSMQECGAHSVTLPHLSEVIPSSLMRPSEGATYMTEDYAQLPPLQDSMFTQKGVAANPHTFGDLAYVW